MPAVYLVEGLDEDALAYRGRTVLRGEEIGDVAQAAVRVGHHAEEGGVAHIRGAGACEVSSSLKSTAPSFQRMGLLSSGSNYWVGTGMPTSAHSLLTASGPAHLTRATKLIRVVLSGLAWNMLRRLLTTLW